MPDNAYVKINGIYKRLKTAEAEHCPIYIHAVVGVGKTAAVDYYFRNRRVYRLSGLDGTLDKLTPVEQIKEEVIVIDDLSWITDVPSQQYVCALLEQEVKQTVLIGRSKMPRWLSEEYLSGRLMTADEQYLWMNTEHVLQLSRALDVTIDGKEPDMDFCQQVCQDGRGYPLLLKSILLEIKNSGVYDENCKKRALLNCYHYFDRTFFEMWSPDMCKLLLSIAEFKSFDKGLVEIASQLSNTASVLEYAIEVGDFLQLDNDGKYRLRTGLEGYLLWKRDILWSEEEKKDLHKRLTTYFRVRGDVLNALEQSRLVGDEQAIIELLIQNVDKHPGTAHFYETRQYYFALPEEVICQYPRLISGMSMLYSLILQPEESERWYQKLVEYSKQKTISKVERKIAQSRIAYLDIALPHRGSNRIAAILRSVSTLVANKSVELPEFSVTSNLPSVMNGGKDFSSWCDRDKELAKVLKVPLELALGKYGLGLVNIALAESAFEKASEDDYEIMTRAESGIARTEHGGKVEIAFAGVGVLTKLHISHRQTEQALRMLDDIQRKADEEHMPRLQPNINAMRTWVALLKNDIDAVQKWVEQEPNENTDFYILDRYRYLIKLRCYIALEEYEKAWNLSSKLDTYFTEYDRGYMWVENTLLRAVIAYRQNKPMWRELFSTALEKAKERQLVWVIAQEGIALKPLFEEFECDSEDEYLRRVLAKQKDMTCYYPRYLCRNFSLEEPLTNMERKILSLHAEGIPTDEILEILCITQRTLKFHNSNIYRKLGAKNKQEAIYTAKKYKIV